MGITLTQNEDMVMHCLGKMQLPHTVLLPSYYSDIKFKCNAQTLIVLAVLKSSDLRFALTKRDLHHKLFLRGPVRSELGSVSTKNPDSFVSLYFLIVKRVLFTDVFSFNGNVSLAALSVELHHNIFLLVLVYLLFLR